jgi:hypothetical protein
LAQQELSSLHLCWRPIPTFLGLVSPGPGALIQHTAGAVTAVFGFILVLPGAGIALNRSDA